MNSLPDVSASDVLSLHCSMCSFMTHFLGKLEEHFETEHYGSTEFNLYRCSWCQKVSTSLSFLNEHIEIRHSDRQVKIVQFYSGNLKGALSLASGNVDGGDSAEEGLPLPITLPIDVPDVSSMTTNGADRNATMSSNCLICHTELSTRIEAQNHYERHCITKCVKSSDPGPGASAYASDAQSSRDAATSQRPSSRLSMSTPSTLPAAVSVKIEQQTAASCSTAADAPGIGFCGDHSNNNNNNNNIYNNVTHRQCDITEPVAMTATAPQSIDNCDASAAVSSSPDDLTTHGGGGGGGFMQPPAAHSANHNSSSTPTKSSPSASWLFDAGGRRHNSPAMLWPSQSMSSAGLMPVFNLAAAAAGSAGVPNSSSITPPPKSSLPSSQSSRMDVAGEPKPLFINGVSCSADWYQLKRGSRPNLPYTARCVLFRWLRDHLAEPYPTEEQKERLAHETSLTKLSVNNWFINARRRYVRPLLEGRTVQGFDVQDVKFNAASADICHAVASGGDRVRPLLEGRTVQAFDAQDVKCHAPASTGDHMVDADFSVECQSAPISLAPSSPHLSQSH